MYSYKRRIAVVAYWYNYMFDDDEVNLLFEENLLLLLVTTCFYYKVGRKRIVRIERDKEKKYLARSSLIMHQSLCVTCRSSIFYLFNSFHSAWSPTDRTSLTYNIDMKWKRLASTIQNVSSSVKRHNSFHCGWTADARRPVDSPITRSKLWCHLCYFFFFFFFVEEDKQNYILHSLLLLRLLYAVASRIFFFMLHRMDEKTRSEWRWMDIALKK